MAGKPILHYSEGRGKMESIRWLLAAAGVEVGVAAKRTNWAHKCVARAHKYVPGSEVRTNRHGNRPVAPSNFPLQQLTTFYSILTPFPDSFRQGGSKLVVVLSPVLPVYAATCQKGTCWVNELKAKMKTLSCKCSESIEAAGSVSQ